MRRRPRAALRLLLLLLLLLLSSRGLSRRALTPCCSEASLPFQIEGDGRWRQLVNDSSLWPETSVTAMYTYSMATGISHGWLNKTRVLPIVEAAWSGLKVRRRRHHAPLRGARPPRSRPR